MTTTTRLPLFCITQTVLLTVVFLTTSQNAFTQEQQPHVHGLAELHVVLDGDQLEIEFHSPAMNLLGFEHRANNAEQHALVDKAKGTLAKAETLFQFQPSTCKLTLHETDFSSVTGDKDGEEHKDEHHVHHDNASHDKDEHHGKEHDKKGEERHHSDIKAHYHFQCKNPGELRLMTTSIPTVFPGVHALHAQWVINGHQGATTLDKQQRDIPFNQPN